MTDRDALIEQMRGELELVMADTENPGRYCQVSPAELDALISLASPSPAQTSDQDDGGHAWVDSPHGPGNWQCCLCGIDSTKASTDGKYLCEARTRAVESPSPAQWPEDVVERAAHNIFEHWAFNPDQVPWVPRGNSDKQDTARRLAYAAISKLRPPPPEDERVKGLIAALARIAHPFAETKFNELMEIATTALASYRGGA